MAGPTPADMRRVGIEREDREAFRRDGAPLNPRHLTSREALARFVTHAATIMELLTDTRHLAAVDPALLAARLSCDAYVLPPEYLRLRLRAGHRVFSNGPKPILYDRYAGNAGSHISGRFVAVHHAGLMLHSPRYPRDVHMLFSTLAPNTRDTTPVIIGANAQEFGEDLELRTVANIPDDNLLDPMTLLETPSARPVAATAASSHLPNAA